MVSEFALEIGQFAVMFVFDEPDVVLEPESEEEAFEVGRADPGRWSVVGGIGQVFFGDVCVGFDVEGVTGSDDGLSLVWAEIEIPENAPLLVVEKSE